MATQQLGKQHAAHVSSSPEPSKNLQPPDTPPRNATSSAGSLRAQKKARARKLILDAAQTLISAEGYAKTKMRAVAEAANMSYQTLYNYFPTKGLILQELMTRDLAKVHRATFHVLHGDANANDKLRELAVTYIESIDANDRKLWKEVCAELLKATSSHNCLLDLLDQQAFSKLETAVKLGQKNGQVDNYIEAATLAEVIFSLVDASIMRYLINDALSRPAVLAALSAQLRFCIAPYLR